MSQYVKGSSIIKYILDHKRAVKHLSLVFVITFILGLILSTNIIRFLEERSPINLNFIQTSPLEMVILIFKVAVLFALIVSLPVITYYYVKPTFKNIIDKRNFIINLTSGGFLFLVGALFAVWIIVPVMLFFLIGLNFGLARLSINISGYTAFCVLTALFCGFLFSIPVIRYILIRMKLLDPEILSKKWKYAAVFAVAFPLIIVSNGIFEILFYAATFLIFYGLIVFIAKIY